MAKQPISENTEKQISLSNAIIGGIIILFLGLFIGINWPTISTQFLPYLGAKKTENIDWSALNEVYSALAQNYDGELDKTALVEGAKKGLVEAVGDTYTVYMTAEETEEFNKSLHGDVGAGIGVEMALRENYVRVIRTLPDNPARKAGILAGDILYKVNDEEVYDLSTDEIANKVRGEAGIEVKITIVRDGEEKSFTMKREKINNVSAYVNYSGKTAILTITRFDEDTGTLAQKIASEFEKKDINKVILDLRGNGGGYVSAAKDLLSLWIDGDVLVTQKSILSSDVVTYANHGKAALSDMKTIVLVDGTTASASEIVAGALQDYDKATIVGEQTYGKGVVQTLLDLSAGTTLKVTTAHWYTPKDVNISHTGITPDVKVTNSYEDTNAGRDPQLDKAKSL